MSFLRYKNEFEEKFRKSQTNGNFLSGQKSRSEKKGRRAGVTEGHVGLVLPLSCCSLCIAKQRAQGSGSSNPAALVSDKITKETEATLQEEESRVLQHC